MSETAPEGERLRSFVVGGYWQVVCNACGHLIASGFGAYARWEEPRACHIAGWAPKDDRSVTVTWLRTGARGVTR